jgi:hypothetical protein
VLDSFSGSGTTIMAAERVGRRAFAMEVEPRYVDVAIRRWQAFTGKDAVDAESGLTFNEFAERAGAASGSEDRPAAGGDEIDTSTASKDSADRAAPGDRAI